MLFDLTQTTANILSNKLVWSLCDNPATTTTAAKIQVLIKSEAHPTPSSKCLCHSTYTNN